MLECPLAKMNQNQDATKYIWSIDGKEDNSSKSSNLSHQFNTDETKLVDVTCEHMDCANSSSQTADCTYSQTYLVRAYDEFQEQLVFYSSIPLLIWVCFFSVYLHGKKINDKVVSIKRKEKSTRAGCCKATLMKIFLCLLVLKPMVTASPYIFDVVTDWILMRNHALQGDIDWASNIHFH